MPAVFTPQDDTGLVADANAYIDVATYRQYHLDRGRDTTSTVDGAVQLAIVNATDYIDLRWRLRFAGFKLNRGALQATLWPRRDVWLDGAFLLGLPINLKKACAEYALRAVTGPLVADAPIPVVGGVRQPTGAVKQTSVTVGPITDEVTYDTSDDSGYGIGTILVDGCLFTVIPVADMLIEPLLDSNSLQRRATR